jgi:hypothetical protein
VIHPRTGGSARGRAEEREGWGNGYDLTARMVVKLDCVAMLVNCAFHVIACVVSF